MYMNLTAPIGPSEVTLGCIE
ncbi:hypothetical protein LCGC14_2482810, partial [marine sediment metagenome]